MAHLAGLSMVKEESLLTDLSLLLTNLNHMLRRSGFAYTKMGVNLPAMMINCFKGDSYLDMQRRINGTATYIYERMCLDDFVTGYLTLSEFKYIVRTDGFQFIYDEEESGPQWKFNRYLCFQRVNRLSRKRFSPQAYKKWLFDYRERDLLFTLHTLRSEQNRETAIVGLEHLLSEKKIN